MFRVHRGYFFLKNKILGIRGWGSRYWDGVEKWLGTFPGVPSTSLSGSIRVRGHERLFWERCGGYHADSCPSGPMHAIQQILIIYLRIHANAYTYLHMLHIHTYIQETSKYLWYEHTGKIQTYSSAYLQMYALPPKKYLLLLKLPTYTYTYVQIPAHTYMAHT